ncbi:MAG: WGR domain-containing protein [Candidatus Lariskella arthropodorum]
MHFTLDENKSSKILLQTDSKYYIISVQNNLFHEICVNLVWGALYNRLGNNKYNYPSSIKQAESIVNAVIKKRIRRGYEFIGNTAQMIVDGNILY